MKLKNLLLVSTCALALGTVSTLGSTVITPTTVYAQDQQSEDVQEILVVIKDNLAGVQPINLEQLLEVDDDYLIELYNTEQANQEATDDVWNRMYQQIAVDYPQLNLLTGEDYDTYNEIANLIAANSEYSYSDLNTALPSDILDWYTTNMTENEDAYATVEAILPNITAAREAYIERREQRENEDSGQETPNPEEDAFTQAVIEQTNVTEEQLAQFTKEETDLIIEDANRSNFDQDAMDLVQARLIGLKPEVFTEEQVNNQADLIRSNLIESTPITQEQLDQFDNNYLVTQVDKGNGPGYDFGWMYVVMVDNYPEVFESEINRFKTALVQDFNLNEDELSAIRESELLWAEYNVFNDNNQTENMEALAQVMQDEFGVTVVGDDTESSQDSSSEESSSEDSSEEVEEPFFTALADLTDVTGEQLAQFTYEELEPIMLTAANGNYSQDVMDAVRSQLIQLNPEVFTDDQVSSVAEQIHTALIESTPITQDQLNQLDNNYLVALVGEGNRSGYDIAWAYNTLVEQVPEVFESEVNRFRTVLVEDYNLNEEELSAVLDTDILWEEYRVFMDNNQTEDMSALATAIQENFGVSVVEDSSESSSDSDESSSDEESEVPQSELDIYLETLVNQTDLTMEQLSNFSDEHIQILMNRLGLTTESTSEENLQALRDEIVISGYENFDANQLAQAIASLRTAVVNQTPVTEDIINQIDDVELADLYNEAKNNSYDVPQHVFQQLVTSHSDLFNDLVIEAKRNITQNTTITQAQVDQMQFIDLLLAVQVNEAGEINYVDVTNYLTEKYPDILGGQGSQSSDSQSDDPQSSGVNVSVSSSVEERDGILPNTGESNSIIFVIIGLIALVGGGAIIFLGRNKGKN